MRNQAALLGAVQSTMPIDQEPPASDQQVVAGEAWQCARLVVSSHMHACMVDVPERGLSF
jgi:hypothetical protein